MTLWFTADLHLGHANIIRYCQRPFADVDAMDDALVQRWNEVVAPEDTVWVLGDVALGRIDASLARVAGLAGTKLLLAGNHDRCWVGMGARAEGWTQRYLDAGFAQVHQGVVEVDLDGTPVPACHFPYQGDSHGEDRFVEHRPVDRGAPLLHGHVHGEWREKERMVNVGVDVWDHRPVSADTLAGLLFDRPRPV